MIAAAQPATHPNPAIDVQTNRTGDAPRTRNNGTAGTGNAARLRITNAASTTDALFVGTTGSGAAVPADRNIVPDANTVDLGANMLRWNTIYVNGVASIHPGDPGTEWIYDTTRQPI